MKERQETGEKLFHTKLTYPIFFSSVTLSTGISFL